MPGHDLGLIHGGDDDVSVVNDRNRFLLGVTDAPIAR